MFPKKPGVYIFKNKDGQVIYVGKAINLYHRISSYFSRSNRFGLSAKTAMLSSAISSVETIVVASELEALILEASLIKKYLPKYNVRLTDDKDYLYIGITKEEFPKVITLRKQDLRRVKKFFGPFPSARTVRNTLKLLRKVFPWCSASQGLALRTRRACFYHHLGLCPGVCVGLISKEDYNKIINRFSKFMDGKKDKLIEELTMDMLKLSEREKFEEASKLKKIIDGINYLTQPNNVQAYLENSNFFEDQKNLALQELKKVLNLKTLPLRIEGYDISNIGGKNATGSMVVLNEGDIDKSQYRKFKIRLSGKPNDVAMMREVIRRRLKHKDWPIPNLIIVDGGKGQVNAVNYELQTTNHNLPIFGLAKRREWLYPPEGEISASLSNSRKARISLSNSRKARIIKLSKKSLSLQLLQKLRDEAHRFALTFHRKLRNKEALL